MAPGEPLWRDRSDRQEGVSPKLFPTGEQLALGGRERKSAAHLSLMHGAFFVLVLSKDSNTGEAHCPCRSAKYSAANPTR
jgi:hypothetical protein